MIFVKTDKGICGRSPVNTEYTLCGDAFDGMPAGTILPESIEETEWEMPPHEKTDKKEITCRDCAAMILECRGVRINRETLSGIKKGDV